MDYRKSSLTKTGLHHPGHIIIGPEETALNYIMESLHEIFCNCIYIAICKVYASIKNKQHLSIHWFEPEKSYNKDDFAPLFNTLSFVLEDQERVFFVIKQADLLNTHATNSLLKSLEEPPKGYHFIFLSQRLEILLPTLRSRCLIENLSSSVSHSDHESLISFFTYQRPISPHDFLSVLEQSKITESETNHALDSILTYWNNRYKKNMENANVKDQESVMSKIFLIQDSLYHLPMPGSSKLFWKNFFLKYIHQ